MFCVIYKFHVQASREREFQEGWSIVTRELKSHCGALGSRLHRDEHGNWIAYAQWPDEQTWQNANCTTPEVQEGRALMHKSFIEGNPTETLFKLTVLEDQLSFAPANQLQI